MLFLAENGFIDVVKEEQFEDVVTVSASSALSLAEFRRHSEGKIVVNAKNLAFPFIVHVTPDSAAYLLKTTKVFVAEKVENFSPEPVAYCFRGTEEGTENPSWGYCWPNEVDDIRYGGIGIEEMSFYPLFEIPKELADE